MNLNSPTELYKEGAVKSLVQKALQSTASAPALTPQHLERIITDTVIRLSPELAVLEPEYNPQLYHEFNRCTALPTPNGSMGDGAVTPTYRATYVRDGVYLKVVRRKGAVSNFLQDASSEVYDALAVETENHLRAHVFDLVTLIVWGNAGADAYAFDGLDKLISTNRINKAVGGVVPTDLSDLDDLIDRSIDQGGGDHKKCLVMSTHMLSKYSQLLTNVRVHQNSNVPGMTEVEIKGGWRLQAYRDVPIIVSSGCRPKTIMGTVTASKADTGGTIAISTHNYFLVAAVTMYGEQLASAVADVATTAATSTITLAWADVPNAIYYKIYYHATDSAAATLIKVIAARSYDGDGTPSTRSTGTTLTTVAVDTASVTTAMSADLPLVGTVAAPTECVFLWDLDKIQGLGKLVYTNTKGSKFGGLVTIEPLAKTDDNNPFLAKSYVALVPSFEKTSCVIRNVKKA